MRRFQRRPFLQWVLMVYLAVSTAMTPVFADQNPNLPIEGGDESAGNVLVVPRPIDFDIAPDNHPSNTVTPYMAVI